VWLPKEEEESQDAQLALEAEEQPQMDHTTQQPSPPLALPSHQASPQDAQDEPFAQP